MKQKFKEYYRVDNEESKRIWENGIIVVDTNILLNLYRYSSETSNDVLGVLEHLKNRLWLPYQVCLEYHENRLDRFYENWNASETIKEKLKSLAIELNKFAKDKFSRNPFVKVDELEKVVHRSVLGISLKLDKWKSPVSDFVNNDEILNKVTLLFNGKIGDDFNEQQLKDIYKEGETRYKEKCPPGYKDNTPEKRAKCLRNVFGDLIVWKQVIAQAKEQNKDVVFISDDQKEDWWVDWKGNRIYPRPELIREFRKESEGHRIIFYTQTQFLSYAHNILNFSTADSTIKEIVAVEADKEQKLTEQITNAREFFEKYRYFGGSDIRLGLAPIDSSTGLEFDPLSRLTDYTDPSRIASRQEILQNALSYSEMAKQFRNLPKIPWDKFNPDWTVGQVRDLYPYYKSSPDSNPWETIHSLSSEDILGVSTPNTDLGIPEVEDKSKSTLHKSRKIDKKPPKE